MLVCTFLKKMNSRENFKSIKLGPVYFNVVFSSKTKIFIIRLRVLYSSLPISVQKFYNSSY